MTPEQLEKLQRYPLYTVQQMFNIPPPEMLVEGILPRKTLTGLTAYPGTGKTWLALELARAVATGGKFLGNFSSKLGNVVFVGQDASEHDYAQQLRKLLKIEYAGYDEEVMQGLKPRNPFDDHVHFIIQPGILLEDHSSIMKLAATVLAIEHSEHTEQHTWEDEGGAVHVEEKIFGKKGTDLIVLDTLFSMTRSDMNNNTMMDMAFRNLRWLAQMTGAGVLLVHHNSKPNDHNEGEDWSGGMAQIAGLDNWFHIRRVPRSRERIFFKVKKFRGIQPEPFHYRLTVDHETAMLTFDAAEAEGPEELQVIYDVKEATLEWLAGIQDWQTAKDISDGLTPTAQDFLSRDTLYRKVCEVLRDPTNEGLIEKGPGRRGFRLRQVPLENVDANA